MNIAPMAEFIVLKFVKGDPEEGISDEIVIHRTTADSIYSRYVGYKVMLIPESPGNKRKIGKDLFYVVPEGAIIGIIHDDEKTDGEKVVGKIGGGNA